MKNSVRHLLLGVVGALFGVIAVEDVKAQANTWTNTLATGLWQDATKWSLLAAPTSTHTAVFITNVTTKTVTINSSTPTGNLTISNLTVRGFGAGINTLQLTNAPASMLVVRNGLTIGTNAVLLVTNSVLRTDGQAGGSFLVDGSVTNLAGGQIIATNLTIGSTATGRGNLTTLGELLQVSNAVVVGAVASAQGTLSVAGGSNVFNFSLTVGQNVSATGAVWVTGGQLIVTNSSTSTIVGSAGVGQMTVSNGIWRASSVRIGNAAGTRGVLTLAGGTNTLTSLTLGFNASATGTVWMTGGHLVVTNSNGPIQVGRSGVGEMTVSNGSCQVATVNVSLLAGSQGTLTVAGGTHSIYSGLTLGAITCDATGTVVVTGGQLFVTNAAANATLEVRSGSVTLNSGTLTINSLVITNSCGRFLKTGGSLSITTTNLTPAFDADGDGLPNSWETGFGLSPFIDTGNDGASGDPDGDGLTNLQEYLAGTDPNVSDFRITAIAREGDNIRLTWTTVGGNTNRLLVSPGAADGSYTNTFETLSPVIFVAGSGLTSTNFTDFGGATNGPWRYYRAQLMNMLAADDASDPAYSGGWTNGSNGGMGFGPWTLKASGVINSNTNGCFIGTSTNNAFGTSPGIDVGGKSWGIYANGANIATAFRAFNAPLQVGQSFLINMDNGFIDSGNADGFVLRNGNASSSFFDTFLGARFEFRFVGGTNNYAIVDNTGLYYTTIPFTSTGLRLKFTPTGPDTYSLQVIDNATSVTNTITGTMAASGSLDSLAIYNQNAGAGSSRDAFFNSLQITSP